MHAISTNFDVLSRVLELAIEPDDPRAKDRFVHDACEGGLFPEFVRRRGVGPWAPPAIDVAGMTEWEDCEFEEDATMECSGEEDRGGRGDLLAFSQVSKRWARAAQPLLLQHVCIRKSWQVGALIDTLTASDAGNLVKSIEADIGGSIEPDHEADYDHSHQDYPQDLDLLPLFRLCPSVHTACFPASMVAIGPDSHKGGETAFLNLRSFYSGSGSNPLEQFCHLLLCMPALRALSMETIDDTFFSIEDIPFPPFELERLTVAEDLDKNFLAYEWLLHSSTHSLRSLSMHYIQPMPDFPDGEEFDPVGSSLRRALETCGPSLRHLYLNVVDLETLTENDIIRLCPNLISLKLVALTSQRPGHITIRSSLDACKGPLEHFHVADALSDSFIAGQWVECLRELLEEGHPAFKQLRRLCFGGSPKEVNLSRRDMDSLRAVCEARGVLLDTVTNDLLEE